MGNIFHVLVTQPILNALIWLYDVLPGHDIGFAIIALTILVKALLHPFTVAQIKQQRELQSLQPKIDEIRKTIKDKEEQSKALMELYKKEKVNPAASCLPLLIQIPIFIGLFRAMRDGIAGTGLDALYSFVPKPAQINHQFLGIVDLAVPSLVLAVLAGAIQFYQSWQMMQQKGLTAPPPKEVEGTLTGKEESMAASMNKQMMYMMPVVTILAGAKFPAGLALYWVVMSALTVLQQAVFLKKPVPPKTEPQLQA